MKRKCRFLITLLLVLCFTTSTLAAENDTTETTKTDKADKAQTTEVNPTPQFQMSAKAAVLIEAETGNVVYSKNENEQLPIASITKIMTMLLVMEAVDGGKLNLTDPVTVSATACKMGGSQVYLKEGEVFSVEELLKAVAVHSANDAAVALAEKVAGSEESFVQQMNERAAELKMKHTNFLDATGLTDEGHYSCAIDIAVMARELLLKHPKITYYTTIWHDTFRDGKFDLDNTNRLVNRYRGITGLKTGFTNKAGFCLAASAERDGTKLISVVLGSGNDDLRFSESAKLLDFGFANWETAKIEKKGLPAGTVTVRKGITEAVPLVYSDNAVILVKKGKKAKITENLEIPANINAPVEMGQVVGTLNIELDGKRLASIPVTAANESMQCNFSLMLGSLTKKWSQLFCGACPLGNDNKAK